MKYADLLAKFRTGQVSESDLDGVTAEDWMKVRLEAGDGILSCALTDDALLGIIEPSETLLGGIEHATQLADHDEEEDEKPKHKSRAFSYVMVSDALIPPFSDRVESKAWDLKEFRYRGGVILYDHNFDESRPPIGKGSNLQKGVEMKRGGKSFKALTGDVTFADREIHPFAGMISDLVEAKLLTNGSVGFDIVKMRAPTKDEEETQGFKPYSAIIQKANLFEFSITPLGRDPNAQRLANDGVDPLEAKLAEFARAGIYDDSVIGEFREGLLSKAGEATRCSVAMPEIEYATGGIDESAAAFLESNQVAGVMVPTDVAQTLGLVETTTGTATNDTGFTFNGNTPIIPQPNGNVQQMQFADAGARSEIAELRAELSELRTELASLRRSRDEELYELLLGDDADRATEAEGSPGSDEPADHINDVAIELGL